MGLEEETEPLKATLSVSSSTVVVSGAPSSSATSSSNPFDDGISGAPSSAATSSSNPHSSSNPFDDDLGLEEEEPVSKIVSSGPTVATPGNSKNRFSTKEKDTLFDELESDFDEYTASADSAFSSGSVAAEAKSQLAGAQGKVEASSLLVSQSDSSLARISAVGNNLAVLEQRMIDSLVSFIFGCRAILNVFDVQLILLLLH